MADTYGVVPADVAGELPGLYPGGFSATSLPSDAQVASLITAADTIVTLRLTDEVGQSPAASDKAAVLAKRYVIETVKAHVIRIAYAGRDPVQVSLAAKPYDDAAQLMLDGLDALGAQAVGTGAPSSRVMTSIDATGVPSRDLLITDCDLDPSSRGRF